jgi:hypothetical protein
VYRAGDEPFPFRELPGDRERQQIAHGQRALLGLPTGDALNPFDG